jgi:hypothetical protein
MIDWLSALSVRDVLMAGLAFLVTMAASLIVLGIVGIVFIKMPAGYFCDSTPRHFRAGSRSWVYWTVRIIKNIVGVAVILLGAMMALPGVPGPGLLIALLGVMLIDFAAMRRLERWLLRRPGVLSTINRMRQQYGKPPLFLEACPGLEQESSV